jgi:hypothetical protein
MVSSLSSGSQWYCLAGTLSTVVISIISSHIRNSDEYNILMQFVFWLTEWGMLAWFRSRFSYTGPCGTLETFVAVKGASFLFLFQDLPTWLRLTVIVTSVFFSIVFLEIIFYGIIGHSGGDLGVFGRLHTAIWEWAWFAWTEFWGWAQFACTEAWCMWDIVGQYATQGVKVLWMLFKHLCRICRVRDRQVADQGAHLGGPGLELQVLPQASSPPPYFVSHYIFPSSDTNVYEFGPAYYQPT